MTNSTASARTSQAERPRPIRGRHLLRALNRILPLGRKYHLLLSTLNSSDGLLNVPFAGYRLVMPACWPKLAANVLLDGPAMFNDFNQLLAPLLPRLKPGTIVDAGANLGLYTLLFRSR